MVHFCMVHLFVSVMLTAFFFWRISKWVLNVSVSLILNYSLLPMSNWDCLWSFLDTWHMTKFFIILHLKAFQCLTWFAFTCFLQKTTLPEIQIIEMTLIGKTVNKDECLLGHIPFECKNEMIEQKVLSCFVLFTK